MNADPAFEAELKKRRLRLIPSSGKKIQSVITPEQSRDSVKIIEAEKESIKIGEKILIS